jgi:hypothetical protein
MGTGKSLTFFYSVNEMTSCRGVGKQLADPLIYNPEVGTDNEGTEVPLQLHIFVEEDVAKKVPTNLSLRCSLYTHVVPTSKNSLRVSVRQKYRCVMVIIVIFLL